MTDDLPPEEADLHDKSPFTVIGEGIGALLWVAGAFAVVALIALFFVRW